MTLELIDSAKSLWRLAPVCPIAARFLFNIYIESLNQDYDIILYQAHLQTIYENVLLYLDDPNLEIQLKIFSKFLISFYQQQQKIILIYFYFQ